MNRSIYIYLSILFPVLYMYASPIAGVDLGTFLVLVFSVMMLADKSHKKKLSLPTILSLYLCYAVICTVLGLLGEHYSTPWSIIMRATRLIIVLVIMIGYGYSTYYENFSYIKVLQKISVIVASYAIIQYLVYSVTGIELTNTFGPTRQEIVRELDVNVFNFTYRPPSFFGEPSGVTYFLTPYLCYLLFGERKIRKTKIIEVLIITAGILSSTSGQGLIVLIICWGIWLLLQGLRARNITNTIFFIAAALLLISVSNVDYTIERIFYQDEMNAVEARSGGYDELKKRSIVELFVGSGYGNYKENIYYSSVADIIFCTGIIGMCIVGLMYGMFFIKGQLYKRLLVICSFVLMATGGIFTTTYLCLYLPLLIADRRNIKQTS